MTLRSAAAAGVWGKRDLGRKEEEKGEIFVGVPFVAVVFLGISPARGMARTNAPTSCPEIGRAHV